jgi:hypothetical protein
MSKNSPWTDLEINAAIIAYFNLMRKQNSSGNSNKSEIYRKLSATHPKRSYKAFEFKFQNISAVLYEEKLSYADGLRPMGNYQAALKHSVLLYLQDNATFDQQPVQILTDKLRRLWQRDYLPVQGVGSGRYGLALEYYLSIPQNSSKEADFMGIELKTKHGNSLQTLFSRVPSRYIACENKEGLLDKYGYYDKKRSRQALYTSFNNMPDSLGFFLKPKKGGLVVNKRQCEILEYDDGVLENALLLKHNETVYVSVSTKRMKNGRTRCRFDKLLYCQTPSLIRFMRMANDGNVYLDFTLSKQENRVKDHGFLWRIPKEAVKDLYMKTQVIDLAS